METTLERSAVESTPSVKQSKCDIVYLAKGRPEFTAASLEALAANTNLDRVSRFLVYTDGGEWQHELWPRTPAHLSVIEYGGPVAIMNEYLSDDPAPLWAKIDNDVIVPPGWLDQCLDVMDAHPELDLLGIEPPESRTPAPWAGGKRIPAPEYDPIAAWKHIFITKIPGHPNSCYAHCDSIGGIGMFRTRAWRGRAPMRPHSTYGGFQDWQIQESQRCGTGVYGLTIGWLVPPINLFLLDRIPLEPWAGLSKRYIAEKSQRPWTLYSPGEAESLAGWWIK
jgi:hypothetical protein